MLDGIGDACEFPAVVSHNCNSVPKLRASFPPKTCNILRCKSFECELRLLQSYGQQFTAVKFLSSFVPFLAVGIAVGSAGMGNIHRGELLLKQSEK